LLKKAKDAAAVGARKSLLVFNRKKQPLSICGFFIIQTLNEFENYFIPTSPQSNQLINDLIS
jgi:hypothetical protein